MPRLLDLAERWGGAAVLMLLIFALSSRTADQLPDLGALDGVLKKTGHVLGYGLLAMMYWRGFHWAPARVGAAWILAVLYGLTDELHQGMVPGRSPSAVDALLFDGGGAALALALQRRRRAAQTRSDLYH